MADKFMRADNKFAEFPTEDLRVVRDLLDAEDRRLALRITDLLDEEPVQSEKVTEVREARAVINALQDEATREFRFRAPQWAKEEK